MLASLLNVSIDKSAVLRWRYSLSALARMKLIVGFGSLPYSQRVVKLALIRGQRAHTSSVSS
jgi:hypothetical protein